MEDKEILREQMFEIVKNQLKANDPPETKKTYERLINEGFDDYHVKQMIASCVAVEIYEVLTSRKPYDNDRYIKNLEKLPQEPK